MSVEVKRIFNETELDDRIRILVDRIWPRGISKEKARLDYWIKEIGPSKELRQWFGHDPEKYPEFKERYKNELQSGEQHEALEKLKQLTKEHDKHVLLLFAAKDEKHNQAQVLKEILDHQV